ncbi:MAG: Ig-like domain-containing protein [Lachnospiraceae bacterium]|nr:Ig-like domain-containing protein [Lachnospiraceae bacterium]
MKRNDHRNFIRKGTCGVVVFALMVILLAQGVMAAKNKATTIRLVRTEGDVTIMSSSKEELTQVADMRLSNGDHEITGEKSYAWMSLDDTKAVKLDENSESELRKSFRKLKIILDAGNIFFNVTVPLEKDESMDIRTSTMVTGVRGTCGWVEVTDDWSSRVYLLTGKLECLVTNPIDGKSETGNVTPGTYSDFLVFPREQESEGSTRIESGSFTKDDIPGFVLVELVGDTELIQKIYDESGIDLRGLTAEQANAALAADQAANAAQLDAIMANAAMEQNIVAMEPVWGENGSGEQDAIVWLTMPQKASTVQKYLDEQKVKQVILLPGDCSAEENTLKVDIPFNVPAGKSLEAREQVTALVQSGHDFTVNGTADFRSDITNEGTLVVKSSNTLIVGGVLRNSGTFENTSTGHVILENGAETNGTFTNAGLIEATRSTFGNAMITVSGGTFAMTGGTIVSSRHDVIVRVLGGSNATLDLSGGEILNEKIDAATILVDAGEFYVTSLGTDVAGVTDTLLGKNVDLSLYDAASVLRTDGRFHLIALSMVDSYPLLLSDSIVHGTVVIPGRVEVGAQVTMVPVPDAGYRLESISANYFNGFGAEYGEAIELDHDYGFTMPGHDVIVSAVFVENTTEVAKYKITWKNWDGTVLEEDVDVPEGSIPTYDGAEPTRAKTEQFSYQFIGWTPEVVPANGDASYVATFNEVSEEEPVVNVTGISLDQNSMNLQVGGAAGILTATITPSTATNQKVTWSSSNEGVASVKANGLSATITGMKNGTATITATTEDGRKTATCQVTVTTPVTGISLDQTLVSMEVGKSMKLTATITPSSASNQNVTWSSSDSSVVSVSANGLTANLSALKNGSATITVRTANGNRMATCNVTVSTRVTGISLDQQNANLNVGGTLRLNASITPSTASNQSVTWSSSDTSVATVSANGLSATVTAKKNGSATITVTTADGGKSATCKVTVTTAVTGISLNQTIAELPAGGKLTLTATITPSSASNQNVTWTSSNTSVATVSGNGLTGTVTAKKDGSATITVKTADGSKSASCTVTVRTGVTGVSLNQTSVTLGVNGTSTLKATISPSGASNQNVTWTSSNANVVSVTPNGLNCTIKGLKDGSATITVKTADGGFTASCSVTVRTAVTGVSLSQTSASMNKGDTLQLTATIAPSNATNQSVTWSSSNTSVATVSSSGLVTAKKGGNATITVTTADGNKTATCAITVISPVTGVSLSQTSAAMNKGDTLQLTATITPSDATNKNLTWSSSRTSVATVSNSGLVTAKANGSATITVTTADGGFTATCRITVTTAVTSVSLSSTSLNIVLNAAEAEPTATLTATINPSGASNQNVTWSSNNTSVVSVAGNGLTATLTANGVGTAKITVKTEDGGFTKTCTVTVTKVIEYVMLNQSSATFLLGRDTSLTVTASISPTDATDTTLIWTSSNTSVATVSADGLTAVITPKGVGTATITATAKEGGASRRCTVTVSGLTVNWQMDDGTSLGSTTIAYNSSPSHSAPSKPDSDGEVYTFNGWDIHYDNGSTAHVSSDGTFPAFTQGATCIANFTATVRKYTITWRNVDGSLIDTTQVPYNTRPTHGDASYSFDAMGSFMFMGWTTSPMYYDIVNPATYYGTGGESLTLVQGDATYYGYY